MVKPLNKEWELFGPRYRITGAKGDKVDCHACHKQVSAAVNRLQSHLRVCPARRNGGTTINSVHTLNGNEAGALAGSNPDPGLDVALATTLNPSDGDPDAGPDDAAPDAASSGRTKRPKVSSRARSSYLGVINGHFVDDDMTDWSISTVLAQKRLALEEQRLALEIKRDAREEQHAKWTRRLLVAQTKEAECRAQQAKCEAKVALGLSRKRLRDEGVDAEEIDRLLPVEPTSGGPDPGLEQANVEIETESEGKEEHADEHGEEDKLSAL